MTRHRPAALAAFISIVIAACDPQPEACEEFREAVAIVFDYACEPEDEQVTLGAWGPRFVGAVVQSCDARTLRIELDQPGTWLVEAKLGAEPTIECELVVTAEMIADGVELDACGGAS